MRHSLAVCSNDIPPLLRLEGPVSQRSAVGQCFPPLVQVRAKILGLHVSLLHAASSRRRGWSDRHRFCHRPAWHSFLQNRLHYSIRTRLRGSGRAAAAPQRTQNLSLGEAKQQNTKTAPPYSEANGLSVSRLTSTPRGEIFCSQFSRICDCALIRQTEYPLNTSIIIILVSWVVLQLLVTRSDPLVPAESATTNLS